MKLLYLTFFLGIISVSTNSFAQYQKVTVANCAPPSSSAFLEINNVRAFLLNGGDIWQSTLTSYEIPKGSGNNPIFGGAIWLSGVDNGNNLHTAGQTYRQRGYDFWPGPLNNLGETDANTCNIWNKHFNVYGNDIKVVKNGGTPTALINEWPASIAPYKDLNANGTYEPSLGDYPVYDINNSKNIPDQMVWWVINDKGNTHTAYPGGLPLGLEIQVTAFAYQSDASNIVNNSTMYRYKIINKTNQTIYDFKFGQFVDADVNNGADDDYVGCDLSVGTMGKKRNLFYSYDSGYSPGNATPESVGFTFLKSLKDSSGIETGVSKFMFFTNQGITGINGDPTNSTELSRYVNGNWADGSFLSYGTPNGRGGLDHADFAFPGNTDPQNRPLWIESDVPGDRRMLASMGNNTTILPGEVLEIVEGVVWANAPSGNNLASVELLKLSSDTLREKFANEFEEYWTGIQQEKISASIFPNPTTEKLFVQLSKPYMNFKVEVYSLNGEKIFTSTYKNSSKINVDVSNFLNGVYFVKISSDKQECVLKFAKK